MSGSSSSFPAFLYANWSNTPYAFLPLPPAFQLRANHHPQPRQHRQLSLRTMEIDPQHDEVDRGSPRALTSNDHINIGESGGSSVATGMPPVSSFEDIFGAEGYNMSQWRDFNTNLPDMTYRSADQARADFLMPCNNFNSAYNAHDAHPPTSFGASSSYPSSIIGVDFNSVGDASDVQPLKVDLSPSTLVGLPDRAVNVSEFDTITDSVWSLEVRNLPPLSEVQSSVCSPETYSSGPYTPNDLEDDAYFGGHELHPVRAVAKVENDYADAFNSHPPLRHCLPPTMPHAIQHPQALSAWSIAGGLEYATNTISGASFDTHTAPTSSLPDTGSLQDVEGQAPAAVEDTSDESDDEDSDSTPDVNELAINEATHRRERDRYLLKKRAEGYSYREIKRMGKFREAESTLRGRVRVLTKDKSERVRRPEWNQQDIDLLQRAVDHYVEFEPDSSAKQRNADLRGRVPWKKISEWMKKRGSSYLFAPATCAKKWKDLHKK